MGDLGVSNRPRASSKSEPSTALARITDKAPGLAAMAGSAVATVDQFVDKIPGVEFVTPQKPDAAERAVAGVMAGVYVVTGLVSFIPWVGPLAAGAIVTGGGVLARGGSSNEQVKNHANLAVQTGAWGAGAGLFGWGFVPHFRSAAKEALIAFKRG